MELTLRRWRADPDAGARTAPGTVVYAVGDVHGRLDLLARLHEGIREDAQSRGAARRVIVYLGDYLSRGPDSRAVVELLRGSPMPEFESVRLMGNHEQLALRFLSGELAAGADWLDYGGVQALASYGLHADSMTLPDLREAFGEALPAAHRAFLEGLAWRHVEGDYLFVHAGVRPGVPLREQSAADCIWIRRRFLESEEDHGALVVHGHSISEAPEVRANRIGIDTGAYASGILTCLVLEGQGRWLMQAVGPTLPLRYPAPHEGRGRPPG